ncbi:MAG: EAL domain-containing protein [Halieaceae bacterium]|nr:EAL domain-containing protein [Halieaceae bacterium]
MKDADGTIRTWRLVDANTKALDSWGVTLTDIVGKTVEEIFPGTEATRQFMPIIQQIFESNTPYEWEERFDNTGQILRMVSIPLGDMFISCGVDVSTYREIEARLVEKTQELEHSLKRLNVAARAANLGVWDFDILNNRLVWDRSMYEIYGVDPVDISLPYESWEQGLHRDDRERATRELDAAIAKDGVFRSEFRIVRRDNGEVRDILAVATSEHDSHGRPIRMIGVNYDITEQKRNEAQIERLAYFDTLTGLANRSLIEDRLAQAVASSRRTGQYSALIFIDLDDFKTINDSVGHAVGDEVLASVSKRLASSLRAADTVGRFGGDEFIVILNNLPESRMLAAKAAESYARKIAARIRKPIYLSTGKHIITASMGITLFAGPNVTGQELLGQADLAMYRAKSNGRNTACFFDPVMQENVLQRVNLEKDLQLALQESGLKLHYQPQFDNAGRIRSAEALLRWQHPTRGFVSPNDFIPIAEDSGQIRELGDWVIRTALETLRDRIASYVDRDFFLAINVSAVQLYEPGFDKRIMHYLNAVGVDPKQLMIEVTESALVNANLNIAEEMASLKALGIKFALDDFGTGYSSLTRLKQLPIDELKIDKSFVQDIEADCDDLAIARSIIALADSLGISVIAEGVETASQMKILEDSGCHLFQGYFFSRPIPIDDFVALVNRTASSASYQ